MHRLLVGAAARFAGVGPIGAQDVVQRAPQVAVDEELGVEDLADAPALASLPDTVAMTVLSDAGDDITMFGAGPDFFNGFTGVDQVWGGGGNDWIRTGQDDDLVWGGPGDDQIVGTDGKDTLYGEDGDDLLGGGTGNDQLDGGSGSDLLRLRPAPTWPGPTGPTGCVRARRSTADRERREVRAEDLGPRPVAGGRQVEVVTRVLLLDLARGVGEDRPRSTYVASYLAAISR